jgi:hypothetical protein
VEGKLGFLWMMSRSSSGPLGRQTDRPSSRLVVRKGNTAIYNHGKWEGEREEDL